MGLLAWLFGRTPAPSEPEPPALSTLPTWQISENGNPTILFESGGRLTVFEDDRGGWKFCASQGDGSTDPYFSEPYETVEAAKLEALAYVTATPSRHTSITERYRQEGRARWEEMVDKKADLLTQMKKALEDPNLNVTQLRKIEAKVATQIKQLAWQIDELQRRGVDNRVIAEAERLAVEFPNLASEIEQRIAERKAFKSLPTSPK